MTRSGVSASSVRCKRAARGTYRTNDRKTPIRMQNSTETTIAASAVARGPSRPGPPDAGLTRRERELVALVAAGASNKEIAERLSIAERTVKAHLTSIFRKLGVSSRLHLAVYALDEQGLGRE